MKKNILYKALFMLVVLASSTRTYAQINLGNILSGLTGKSTDVEDTSGTKGLLTGIASIFSKEKQASTDNLVGTWEYSEPAIIFESDNLLAKAGAGIASSKLEDKLQEQLSKFQLRSMKMVLSKRHLMAKTYPGNGKSRIRN